MMPSCIIREMEEGLPGWNNFYKMSGGWDAITIASVMTEQNKYIEGMNIADIAKERGEDPYDTFFPM